MKRLDDLTSTHLSAQTPCIDISARPGARSPGPLIHPKTIRPVTFTTLIVAIIFCSSLVHTKPFKSHRCLDWRFGGWSPMLYSLQPSVSPPIYHRPQQSYPAPEQLSKQTSANYVKKLRPPTQNWLPYQSGEEQGQAKVVRYNVRKPSGYAGQYPKYPQYLPTTVLRLKPVKPNNYQSADGYPQNYPSSKMNAYRVPMKANYAVKNIYSQQPVIYEQLDYQTSSRYPQTPSYPQPPSYPQKPGYSQAPSYPQKPSYPQTPNYPQPPSYPQTPNYRPSYPVKSPQQPAAYPPSAPPSKPQYPPKPAKSKATVAAYIPVIQVPAIEQPSPVQKPKIEALPVLNIKKPLAGYEEKIVEEHIYQIPNHMLHEVRHEVHGPPKSIYPTIVIAQPAPGYAPAYRPHRPIGQAVSHMHQSFGSHYVSHGAPHGLPGLPKPQISYDTPYKPVDDGPPVVEMPYYGHMENYAKAEDAGLFKPLLDRTRQSNQFPKIGSMPYKDNDPENLNVIHLIANQKHLPLVVPITSIHISNDGSYPITHNERPIMEKQIPSYSEMPVHHQKPPQPYGPVGGDASYATSYGPSKIEQEKNGYVEEEKVILQQLNAKPEQYQEGYKQPQYQEAQYKEPQPQYQEAYKQPQPQYQETYKEPQPQYVIHQEYNPVPSVPDLPSPPEAGQYQVSNDNQQVIEQVKVTEEYPAYPQQYPQQQAEVKGTEYTVQQQEDKSAYPVEQVKEPILPQIQQITTEYIKHEEPKVEQQTDSYNQKQTDSYNQQSYVQQAETPVQVQEVIVKEGYPTQDYKVKGAEEYGRRVPATNYQYVKPSNLPVQSYEQQSGGYSSSDYPAQSSYPQSNDQSYSQQQVATSQKTVQHDGGSREQLSEEQANIAAYEEARKSILQNSYQPLVYQQPSSYQEQVSYQPPLSTAYDTKSEKASDYSDDYSYRAESKDQAREEVKSTGDRVYDLPSNTAEKVVTVTGNGQSEILSSEEQTKKSSYEILPEQKTVVSVVTSVSSSADEKQLADAKSDNGQKYGERLVYVKSPKFKNLRTVNGNTYLGDTLLYSASTRSNSTLRRHRENGAHRQLDDSRRSSRIRAEVLALSSSGRSTSGRSASTRSPPVRGTTSDSSSASSTEIEKLEVVTIGSEIAAANNKSADQTETGKSEANTSGQTNATEAKSAEDEQVVNYVKPVSRAALRSLRLKKLKKDEDGKEAKLSSTAELSSSASEQFESKMMPDDAVLDLTNLNVEELASNLKADEEDLEASGSENVASSQLYHAYYGPPNHQPEPGYVRLTVQQFKEIFKDAEIHVLKSDQNTQLASSSSSASPVNSAPLTASSTATPAQA